MSFSVAMQPKADRKQLITSGRTGTGDMFSGISVTLCQTDQITLANLTSPLQAIDERALAGFTEVTICHIVIFTTNYMSDSQPAILTLNRFHYRLSVLLSDQYLTVLTPRLITVFP